MGEEEAELAWVAQRLKEVGAEAAAVALAMDQEGVNGGATAAIGQQAGKPCCLATWRPLQLAPCNWQTATGTLELCTGFC